MIIIYDYIPNLAIVIPDSLEKLIKYAQQVHNNVKMTAWLQEKNIKRFNKKSALDLLKERYRYNLIRPAKLKNNVSLIIDELFESVRLRIKGGIPFGWDILREEILRDVIRSQFRPMIQIAKTKQLDNKNFWVSGGEERTGAFETMEEAEEFADMRERINFLKEESRQIARREFFTVTESHRQLLRKLYISHGVTEYTDDHEYGEPYGVTFGLNLKRPFGNTSEFYGYIAEAMGFKTTEKIEDCGDILDVYSKKQRHEMDIFILEVISICVPILHDTLNIIAGEYIQKSFKWKLKEGGKNEC